MALRRSPTARGKAVSSVRTVQGREDAISIWVPEGPGEAVLRLQNPTHFHFLMWEKEKKDYEYAIEDFFLNFVVCSSIRVDEDETGNLSYEY
jgi:hypothetical protein